MVLVGHSLGGILAKMMVQSGGPQLWQTVCARPIDQVIGPTEECQLLQQAFFYKPVPEVRRVIFIATPHRGSPLASGPLRELGTRLCWRPSRFRQAREMLLARDAQDTLTPGFRREFPTSVGELVPGHPLLMALRDAAITRRSDPIRSSLTLVTRPIPARPMGSSPTQVHTWRVFDSELLINGQHSCLESSAVIREVRRILMEHAGINSTCRIDQENHCRFESLPERKVRGPRKQRELQKTQKNEGTTTIRPNDFERLIACVRESPATPTSRASNRPSTSALRTSMS